MCFSHLFRRNLTRDASGISMEDDFYYESPCANKKKTVHFPAVKYLSNGLGKFKFESKKLFRGVVCEEYESVHDMWYVSFNATNIPHKVCNPQGAPHMYCFTETETRPTEKVSFKIFIENGKGEWVNLNRHKEGTTSNIKYGAGCACGWQHKH